MNRIFDELLVGELFGRVEFDVNDPDTADVLRLDSLCPGFDLDSNTGEITLRLKSLLLRLLINTLYIYIKNTNQQTGKFALVRSEVNQKKKHKISFNVYFMFSEWL